MIILIYISYTMAALAGICCILAPFLENHPACKPEETTHGNES